MPALSGYCKACSLCCKYPFVLPEEKEEIFRNISLQKRRHFRRVGDHFIIDGNPCPFLRDSRCTIEEIKPACCRVFPLVLESDGKKFFWKISEECPLKREVPASYFKEAETMGKKLLEFHNKRVIG